MIGRVVKLTALGAAAVLIVRMLPDLRRYIRMREM